MKFTEDTKKWGWMDTEEDSKLFMKDEILYSINNGEYKDIDEVIKDFAQSVIEYDENEIKQMQKAIQAREEELQEIAWLEEYNGEVEYYEDYIDELNSYWRATRL